MFARKVYHEGGKVSTRKRGFCIDKKPVLRYDSPEEKSMRRKIYMAKWMRYPDDFELYHAMLVNNRREIAREVLFADVES